MKATRKLVFTLILATLALVGALSVTPEPAHAIYCSNNFLGCYYSYVELTASSLAPKDAAHVLVTDSRMSALMIGARSLVEKTI